MFMWIERGTSRRNHIYVYVILYIYVYVYDSNKMSNRQSYATHTRVAAVFGHNQNTKRFAAVSPLLPLSFLFRCFACCLAIVCTMAPRGTAAKSKEDSARGKPIAEPIRNEKGKICNWDSRWVDAKTLAVLVECGTVKGMTPGQIQRAHEQFAKYQNSTLSSALTAMKNKLGKEVDVARGSGSSGELFAAI